MPTTASEAVVEPVSCEPSRTRITSPPMLLGQEVVEEGGDQIGRRQPPQRGVDAERSSSSRQRQVASASIAT